MNAPMTHVEVETRHISTDQVDAFATISRMNLVTHTYRLSDASRRRLIAAIHGQYSCKWPLGGSRQGWYTRMVVSDEQSGRYWARVAARSS